MIDFNPTHYQALSENHKGDESNNSMIFIYWSKYVLSFVWGWSIGICVKPHLCCSLTYMSSVGNTSNFISLTYAYIYLQGFGSNYEVINTPVITAQTVVAFVDRSW